MTQKEKDLLLKDLCGRLPYGVCYEHFTWDDECGEDCIAAQIYSINPDGYVKNCYDDETVCIDNVRPYLFPLSSMTEKQKKELLAIFEDESDDGVEYKVVDFYNKNHIDYRGLIPMGLALDATELNIY